MDATPILIAFGLGAVVGALGGAFIGRILVSLLVDELHRLQVREFSLQEENRRLTSWLDDPTTAKSDPSRTAATPA